MRTMDRKDAIQHEADELAAEAFDQYPPRIEQWVRDAFVGEWKDIAESAAKEVMAAAVRLSLNPINLHNRARLCNAVEQLRDAYVDYASVNGLYAAEAEDNINCAASDEAQRLQDLADDRNVDAYNAALRG